MPKGVHKSKRPSGAQQRKGLQSKLESLKCLEGSLLRFVVNKNDSGGAGMSTISSTPDDGGANEILDSEEHPGVHHEDIQLSDQDNDSINSDVPRDTAEPNDPMSDNEGDIASTPSVSNSACIRSPDVSTWAIPVSNADRTDIVEKGSDFFRNSSGTFHESIRLDSQCKGQKRCLTKDWFFINLADGQKVPRKWMVYSPNTGKVFCFCCRLFATDITKTCSAFVYGFDKWWKLSPKVVNHENSTDHIR